MVEKNVLLTMTLSHSGTYIQQERLQGIFLGGYRFILKKEQKQEIIENSSDVPHVNKQKEVTEFFTYGPMSSSEYIPKCPFHFVGRSIC